METNLGAQLPACLPAACGKSTDLSNQWFKEKLGCDDGNTTVVD
jgi:hypothetical protein